MNSRSSILACLAAVDPRPAEMMAIYQKVETCHCGEALLLFSIEICGLEEDGLIAKVLETEECVLFCLTESGRKEFESTLPAGLTLEKFQAMVAQAVKDVSGQAVPKVC